MLHHGFVRRAILAGTLALSLTGMAIGTAQAMPAAPLDSNTTATAPTMVQYYYGYGYRPFRRPFYGNRYRGQAGLYRCGPYAQHTHLERKACR